MSSNSTMNLEDASSQEIQEISFKGNKENGELKPFSFWQLFNLCIGFLGLQFAWSMQINLSGRVVEPLGVTPQIFGLMWLAGPITGILVQPLIGIISDNTWTKYGRRHPFLLIGSILGALGLLAFPNAEFISNNIGIISPILVATAFLWIIDACVNISQGPYRALIPDVTPQQQHAVANSFLSFAIGLGSVIAFFTPTIVKDFFNYEMSIFQQFMMAAVAFVIAIVYTIITTPEKNKPLKTEENTESALDPVKNFGISAGISAILTSAICLAFKLDLNNDFPAIASYFALILSVPMLWMSIKSFESKEAWKLCFMQFFTWLGIMSMFIYFNNFVVHNIFAIPDLSSATEAIKTQFNSQVLEASRVSGSGLGWYNLICVIASVFIGSLSLKYKKKYLHSFALIIMALSFFGLAFWAKDILSVYVCMAIAGIGWASVLALPFALLTEHIVPGTEGSAMGKFNLFIAGPQILSSVAVGYLITKNQLQVANGMTHHWEYAFIVGGLALLVSALITLTVKETAISQ
ncbi:MAG: MFS transporter [Candidatus Gastranaerophilales bacterium]|nr:MFS transporter [Candidatus Gastranaerophilales bacterium]